MAHLLDHVKVTTATRTENRGTVDEPKMVQELVTRAEITMAVEQVSAVSSGLSPDALEEFDRTIARERLRVALYGPIEELLYQLYPLVLFYEGETGRRDMRAIYDGILAEVNRPSMAERAGDIALVAMLEGE